MKIIEPTHKEIMEDLNCCLYSYLNKDSCICHNPSQFKDCYKSAKMRLTKKIYTAEEIAEHRKNNEKAMQELHSFFDEFSII